MAIYFTLDKSPAAPLTVIFDADGFERAMRYKEGLVLDGKYTKQQITVSGTDSAGRPVNA